MNKNILIIEGSELLYFRRYWCFKFITRHYSVYGLTRSNERLHSSTIWQCWDILMLSYEKGETGKKSEMNPLNYSRCCRNTWIKLYFSVSENVYVQWFLMKPFQKKMRNCQVSSLVKKRHRKLPCKHFLLPVKRGGRE